MHCFEPLYCYAHLFDLLCVETLTTVSFLLSRCSFMQGSATGCTCVAVIYQFSVNPHLFQIRVMGGHEGVGFYPSSDWERGRNAPWTGHQSITGHPVSNREKVKQSSTVQSSIYQLSAHHSLFLISGTDGSGACPRDHETRTSSHSCFWTVGGNQNTWRKPTLTEENM